MTCSSVSSPRQLIRHAMQGLEKALEFWGNNPVDACKDWFGVTPEDYQAEALIDLFSFGRVAMKSAHGVGKTTTMAWATWIFLQTRPLSLVAATAPTAAQLLDVLWPEIGKWHIRMPEQLREQWMLSSTHVRHKTYDKNWFATARTSNKETNMQGFHNNNVLVLMDEAPGIIPGIFQVVEGILSNADEHGQEARIMMTGNPVNAGGDFYDAFNKNAQLYRRITVTGDATTKLTKMDGKAFLSKRVSQRYRDTMLRKYGDGGIYEARVRGIFPVNSDKVVIPLSWAERAQYIELPHFDDLADPVTLVMDVARMGGNKTTLGLYRRGHCIAMHAWPKTSTNQCADILVEAYNHGGYDVGKVERGPVIIDEPGVGGGVIDVARRYGVPVVPYNGSAKFIVGVDPDEHIRMFRNRRARDWWMARRRFEQSLSKIPVNEDIVNELASVQYDYENEKIWVESKRDMIERLGELASPDYADNIIMGLAPYLGVESVMQWAEGIEVEFGGDRPTANMDFGYGFA
jgi:phage terminase large subunit